MWLQGEWLLSLKHLLFSCGIQYISWIYIIYLQHPGNIPLQYWGNILFATLRSRYTLLRGPYCFLNLLFHVTPVWSCIDYYKWALKNSLRGYVCNTLQSLFTVPAPPICCSKVCSSSSGESKLMKSTLPVSGLGCIWTSSSSCGQINAVTWMLIFVGF